MLKCTYLIRDQDILVTEYGRFDQSVSLPNLHCQRFQVSNKETSSDGMSGIFIKNSQHPMNDSTTSQDVNPLIPVM